MFRSYRYLSYNHKTKLHVIKITDSDFVVIVTVNGSINVAVAKEYARRNLSVAKNLVLLCLEMESLGNKMKDIILSQDKYCPEHIDNWAEIATERNRILDKLSAMK